MSTWAHRLLSELRSGEDAGGAAHKALGVAPGPEGVDAHADARALVVDALLEALGPNDHGVAAWLLEQEVAAHRAAGYGAGQTLVALVAAVARFGHPEDALLLWRAWAATLDTGDAVEVEHLGRAGVERVLDWLTRASETGGPAAAEAHAALAWLERGMADGAFDNLAAYFAWSDEANGLGTYAPT